MACMFYFARCMNIIFNSLLAQLVKYDVSSQNKIDTRDFYHILLLNLVTVTFLSFDNHFETKVLFLMYFGSQIINEYYDDTNNGRMAD